MANPKLSTDQQGAIIEAIVDLEHRSFSVGDISTDPEVRKLLPQDRVKAVREYLDQMVVEGILVKTGKRWYKRKEGHQW